ncbi:transketolase C-terminal domain-containing protein [Marivivens sp. LCG002]|uniref:alpha-ketoacid dehydrogenase subunit beta n=1 Tax=Marivivens sp. LCG002 TaxID=3051171 RepID=UPI002556423F|nr:transketolase C-terminal domain-containing protein [Marivivens sp. LCG002]WIV51416.1 transketolase C-terminal domain-containing protein [Marivivens sp. LCG002]
MTVQSYGKAIRDGFAYLLENHPETFVIGQGLWSPWYVGSSMTELEKEFGKERVIDTPVSEWACTSAAVGASLFGKKPIVVHPRMDFMIFATDSLVNQAAKWSHMLGGQAHPGLTVRGIINRGGEQGAQHSQSLQSWYAHIPGLRVVMPYTPQDARDLLIAATLCPDPVLYIDDRWLYEQEAQMPPAKDIDLTTIKNEVIREGADITLAGCSWGTHLAMEAAAQLEEDGISCEVVDLRVLNPFDGEALIQSVRKTGRLVAIDASWKTCGIASEAITRVVEAIEPRLLRSSPLRITLPDAPAPSSSRLEAIYYPKSAQVVATVKQMLN